MAECIRTDGISEEMLFETLAHQRRRHVLDLLSDRSSPAALADLATDVAARETDATAGEVSAGVKERVHAALYHVHVPKLAAVDLVRYDRDRNVVALSADGDRVTRWAANRSVASADD